MSWCTAAVLLAALACLDVTVAAPPLLDFTQAERSAIAAHGPWPTRRASDRANRVEGRPAAVAFGRSLFFDRTLSASGDLSCASCHDPARAFQDGRPVAQGAARGHRNTPSLLDAAQQRWFGWGGDHDSLWAASLAPLLSPDEMGGRADALTRHVRGRPDLVRGYRAALGPLPAVDEALLVGLAKALAAYQATLASPRTPFDDFRDALLRGDRQRAARYPSDAQRGLRLFIGEGRCAVCHAGPAFTNGEFADIGLPFFLPGGGVDAGRQEGLARLQASRYNRLGPHNDAGVADPRAVGTRHVVALHRNFGEFRVPGLRGLVHSAPYMHDGSKPSLEDVVRHYSELDEERLHVDGERILQPLRLGPEQAADVVAFLRSLSR